MKKSRACKKQKKNLNEIRKLEKNVWEAWVVGVDGKKIMSKRSQQEDQDQGRGPSLDHAARG